MADVLAGVTTWKSVSDMWNYQEILTELRPALVVEFGTRFGGSALFFASVLRQLGQPFRVFSVDISHMDVADVVRGDADIELMESSSTMPAVAHRVAELRNENPGPVFAILDSDHTMEHVLAEMKLLRPILLGGDYMIVEIPMSMAIQCFPVMVRGHTRPLKPTSVSTPTTTSMIASARPSSGSRSRPTGF